jgi:hypothetical protein
MSRRGLIMAKYEYTQAEPTISDEQRAAAVYHAHCLKRNELWNKRRELSKPEDLIVPSDLSEGIAQYLSILPTVAETSSKLSGVDALLTAFETAAEMKCDSVTAVILDECRDQWRYAVRSYDPNLQQTANEVWVILSDITSKLTRIAFRRDVDGGSYCKKWKPVVFDGGMGMA